ncbi:MAG TPA: DUF2169 domain-containing protein [Acetobacteraceae bacterium]|nr:DUF2169 domain-containing protein [Acetobacteraceae bacterium]
MWAIDNRTPFAAERGGARDRDGAELWLVCVKATFDLFDDGSVQLAERQEKVHMAPEFHGDPVGTGLKHDTDLQWGKPGTDVLLRGSAFSCEGPVVRLPIAFQVGPVRRQAVVIGERRWERATGGVVPGPPVPFTASPLTWERAYGGTDRGNGTPAWEPRNPVGRGFSRDRAQAVGAPLPTVEHPQEAFRSPADRPTPMGFGPIARHWHPRATFAGTYDAAWMQDRRPLLPLDYDLRYHFAAPPEQQVPDRLFGGESVRLANLHPRVPRYASALPRTDLRFRTVFRGRTPVHHTGRLSSVTVDTDRSQLIMAWVSELPCHHTIQRLLRTEIRLVSRVRIPAVRGEAA